MKAVMFFFVMALLAMATALASAPQTDTLGNIAVTALPLASGESVCDAFGGDNTDDLYLVTLQGAVSRAYKVDQGVLTLVTDSTPTGTGAPLCIQGATARTAGQVGTVLGETYVTTLGPTALPQSIVISGNAILQLGTTLPGGTVVTSFRSQPVASDGPVVIVNEDSDNLLYRYYGSTWTPVPKPAGKWSTYHVVGTSLQRDVYAEDGLNTVAVFSNNTTTTLFDSNHPPVAGNPTSCCLTMTISPFDGTGIVSWGTGQNSYRVASFAPGQPPALVAQAGTPPIPSVWPYPDPLIPTLLWPIIWAGGNVLFMATSMTADFSAAPNLEGEYSYLWGAQTGSFQGIASSFQGIAWVGEIFLGSQSFQGLLPYGNRINSQLQGVFCVRTTTTSELALWGYIPGINAVFEDASGEITLQTNVAQDATMTVYANIYGRASPTPVTTEGNGIFKFQTPGNLPPGNHLLQIWVMKGDKIASSAWLIHNFGTPTPPTIDSFTSSPTSINAGQTATLGWSVANASTVSIDHTIGAVSNPTGTIAVSPTTTTTYTLTACAGGCSTATVTVTVTPAPPVINAGGVLNAATFDARFSPASIITVFGQNLAGGTATALFQQGAFVPAWTDQTGQAIQVLVGGQPCPLIYVAPTQINCQLSWATSVGSPVAVQALKGGQGSNMVNITLTATAPAPFMYQGMAIVTDLNWQLVTASNPAIQGGVYTLWLQGLGPTTNNPADGVPFSDSPLPKAQSEVKLTIAGNSANVLYAGGAPGEVINQLNFVLPALPPGNGDAGPVTLTATLTVGGQTFTLSVPVQ
jgi:uncharacterized protein (TIGR03437 family)